MVRERHPERWKPPYGVNRVAGKDHRCAWCPHLIEKGIEYYHAQPATRYHLECWEVRNRGKDMAYIATRERNHDPTKTLAYWFVTEFLGEKFSWQLHKKHLATAKRFVNPDKPDPMTGEAQRYFAVEEIKGCLNAMKSGHFGKPMLNIRTISAVSWKNMGRTYLEAWLEIPPIPPTYQKMDLQNWIKQYGDRAVEQEAITAGELEMLRAVVFPDKLTADDVTWEELGCGYTAHEPDQTYGAAD